MGKHLDYICRKIEEIRGGRCRSFGPLQGLLPTETSENHAAFAGDLSKAKKDLGVTGEEWESWQKSYKEYLEEEIIDVQVLSVQGELVYIKILWWPRYDCQGKFRERTVEIMCKLSDLPHSDTPVEIGNWYDARVRFEGNRIARWVSWEPGFPPATDEEIQEFIKKYTVCFGSGCYAIAFKFVRP